MKTIFKANGKSFDTIEEVEAYAQTNGYKATIKETFTYKGKIIKLVELTSI